MKDSRHLGWTCWYLLESSDTALVVLLIIEKEVWPVFECIVSHKSALFKSLYLMSRSIKIWITRLILSCSLNMVRGLWNSIAGDIVSVSLKSMGLIFIASSQPSLLLFSCEKDFRWEAIFFFFFQFFLNFISLKQFKLATWGSLHEFYEICIWKSSWFSWDLHKLQ